MTKVVLDKELGEIVLTKRRVSRCIKIRVDGGGKVQVSLPWYSTYFQALRFVEANRERIAEARRAMWTRAGDGIGSNAGAGAGADAGAARDENRAAEKLQAAVAIESLRRQAKATLPSRVAELAQKHGFTYNKVYIKNNRSNWGSCSSKKNINLNLQLMRLPQELIDYVILHELCHLVYMNHGAEFHKLLNSLCNGREKELRSELKKHRLVAVGR